MPLTPTLRSRVGALALIVLGIGLGRASTALPAWAQDGAGDPPSEAHPGRETLAVPEGQPRYLEAMRSELEAMGITGAACDVNDSTHAMCVFHQEGETSHRDLEVRLSYSDVTDTVYLHIPAYLTAVSDGEHTDAVMRRLMELNWTMLIGKFEWDPTDGEVRISTVLHTDSNFDRRAFRAAIRGVGSLADAHYAELSRLSTTGR